MTGKQSYMLLEDWKELRLTGGMPTPQHMQMLALSPSRNFRIASVLTISLENNKAKEERILVTYPSKHVC
jgi:hypothetical protein